MRYDPPYIWRLQFYPLNGQKDCRKQFSKDIAKQFLTARKLYMENNIIQLTEAYALQLFNHELPPDLRYHDLEHTLSVRETALALGKHYNIGPDNLEAMEIATFLHDTGYVSAYTGHEKVSADLAENFLRDKKYPAEKIQVVKDLIHATKLSYEPKTLMQKIIKDADLNNLGQGKYLRTISNLRFEMKRFLGLEYSDIEFFEMNLRFIDNHAYFTEKAGELFDKKKAKNRIKVEKELAKRKLGAASKKGKAGTKKNKKKTQTESINGNRSAQMMFKTALRNHIDLTSIADNKANIMLSINALIITISLPLLASEISDNPDLILPTSILLITCIASIIYATLATRPIKTKGLTSVRNIESGPTNLFFYGNFYRMNFKNYKAGIKMIIEDDDKLDDSIMSDLFYLGKALGNKFIQLRVCYTIFMVGITLTVLAFGIMFLLSRPGI